MFSGAKPPQAFASLYQRIEPLKCFDFRGPIVRANLSTNPLQFSSSCNEQHLKLGKGDPFYEVIKPIISLFTGYWYSFLQFTRF